MFVWEAEEDEPGRWAVRSFLQAVKSSTSWRLSAGRRLYKNVWHEQARCQITGRELLRKLCRKEFAHLNRA